MGAVRMRVQTDDKNITVIDNNAQIKRSLRSSPKQMMCVDIDVRGKQVTLSLEEWTMDLSTV